MILVLIENRWYLTKVLSYLDELKLPYTTDIEREFEILIVAECSNKIKSYIQEHPLKKIIFLAELEEPKWIKNYKKQNKTGKSYQIRFQQFCNMCTRIVVTMPAFKNILKKKTKREIYVLPKELPIVPLVKTNREILQKYHISKKNKCILILDIKYEHLSMVSALAHTYPKFQFLLIGYQAEYLLTKREKKLLYTLPSNVIKQKYIDANIYSDLCYIAWMIVHFYQEEMDFPYLNIPLLLKRQLLIEYHFSYQDYFINSKNTYLFQTIDELQLRFKKLVEERVANLTDNGYDLILQSTHKEILKKWVQILTI